MNLETCVFRSFMQTLIRSCVLLNKFFILSDKKIAPKAGNDVKLISAGKILENSKTVAQCKMPFGDLPKGVITMHAVVQPSLAKAKTGNSLTHQAWSLES